MAELEAQRLKFETLSHQQQAGGWSNQVEVASLIWQSWLFFFWLGGDLYRWLTDYNMICSAGLCNYNILQWLLRWNLQGVINCQCASHRLTLDQTKIENLEAEVKCLCKSLEKKQKQAEKTSQGQVSWWILPGVKDDVTHDVNMWQVKDALTFAGALHGMTMTQICGAVQKHQ